MLFFVPFLNLLFFLCPFSRYLPATPTTTEREIAWAKGIVIRASRSHKSVLGSAAISLLLTVPLVGDGCDGRTSIDELWLGNVRGSSVHHGVRRRADLWFRQPRSLGGCIGVACLSIALLGLGLVGLAIEGVFCLVMAMPIAFAAGRLRRIFRLPGAAAALDSRMDRPRVPFRSAGFCSGSAVDGARGCADSSRLRRALLDRHASAAGKSVETSGFLYGDSAAYGMAFPGWHRLSNPGRNFRGPAPVRSGIVFFPPVHLSNRLKSGMSRDG